MCGQAQSLPRSRHNWYHTKVAVADIDEPSEIDLPWTLVLPVLQALQLHAANGARSVGEVNLVVNVNPQGEQ